MNLLEWWNFMFLVPLVSGLLLGLGIAVTGFGAGGGEVEATADMAGDASESPPALAGFFGLSQGIPLSIMLPILLVFSGLSGLLLNSILSPWLSPVVFVPLSLLGSLLIGGPGAQGVAYLLRRTLYPSPRTRHDLVGRLGRVVHRVSTTSGTLHVRDAMGSIHRLPCRTAQGLLAPGQEVVIVAYDTDQRIFWVEAHGDTRRDG